MSEQLSIFAFILILATELDDGFAKYAMQNNVVEDSARFR